MRSPSDIMAQNLAPIVSPGAQRRIPWPGCALDFLGYRIMWLMPPAKETEGGQDREIRRFSVLLSPQKGKTSLASWSRCVLQQIYYCCWGHWSVLNRTWISFFFILVQSVWYGMGWNFWREGCVILVYSEYEEWPLLMGCNWCKLTNVELFYMSE